MASNGNKRKRRQSTLDAEREAVRAEDAANLDDLKWFAHHAIVVEFDSRTGRPIRNETFRNPSKLDPIDGLVKISHIPPDVLRDLTTIHNHIKVVTGGRMVSWSGVGGEWDGRLRAFGFPTRDVLRKLDTSHIRLRDFEKMGSDAEEDEKANRAAICILDEKQVQANGHGGEDDGKYNKLSVESIDAARRLCDLVIPEEAGLPPDMVNASQLVAYQPNLHNGAAFLKPHLDQPLHEGFGKVIVTVAIHGGGATIILLEKDENGVTEQGEQHQRSWRFHLNQGEAYVLSGRARNLCLHGVIADNPSGVRESLNLRFGKHSLAEAKTEIFDHWPASECPNLEDCVPYSSA